MHILVCLAMLANITNILLSIPLGEAGVRNLGEEIRPVGLFPRNKVHNIEMDSLVSSCKAPFPFASTDYGEPLHCKKRTPPPFIR